jgi:F0F1-type ATP synthase membrane subunit b/b'
MAEVKRESEWEAAQIISAARRQAEQIIREAKKKQK